MKIFRSSLLVALLLTTASVSLTSCKKDDAEVTIIEPRAGDYVGADAEDGAQYITRIHNTSDDPSKLFIVNIGNLGLQNEFQINGNDISMSPTHYDYEASATTTYSGNISATGKIEGSILTLEYTITGPAAFLGPTQTYTGHFTGDRDFKAPIVQGTSQGH